MQGMALLATTALVPGLGPHDGANTKPLHFVLLYTSLYIVAFGTGGIKPNVSAFGADQFEDSDPEESAEKKSFFNWFYFSINLGSIIAMTVVVWIQVCSRPHFVLSVCPRQHSMPSACCTVCKPDRITSSCWASNEYDKRHLLLGAGNSNPAKNSFCALWQGAIMAIWCHFQVLSQRVVGGVQSWSWGLGFSIPALAMALAVIIFLSGQHKYKRKRPDGSPIGTAANITWHALEEFFANLLTVPSETAAPERGPMHHQHHVRPQPFHT
jgi:dipeptide/tripeptide permease